MSNPPKVDRAQCLIIREHYEKGATLHELTSRYHIGLSTACKIVNGSYRIVSDLPSIAREVGRPRKTPIRISNNKIKTRSEKRYTITGISYFILANLGNYEQTLRGRAND